MPFKWLTLGQKRKQNKTRGATDDDDDNDDVVIVIVVLKV